MTHPELFVNHGCFVANLRRCLFVYNLEKEWIKLSMEFRFG